MKSILALLQLLANQLVETDILLQHQQRRSPGHRIDGTADLQPMQRQTSQRQNKRTCRLIVCFQLRQQGIRISDIGKHCAEQIGSRCNLLIVSPKIGCRCGVTHEHLAGTGEQRDHQLTMANRFQCSQINRREAGRRKWGALRQHGRGMPCHPDTLAL